MDALTLRRAIRALSVCLLLASLVVAEVPPAAGENPLGQAAEEGQEPTPSPTPSDDPSPIPGSTPSPGVEEEEENGADVQKLEAAGEEDKPPNLLVIMTDDQRIGTMQVMPETVANFNLNFRRAFVTTPVCCPSRATMLTGQYAHRTKVRTNRSYGAFRKREHRSLAPWLQARGYYTGFVGKYMNHYTAAHGVAPGWDEFYALVRNDEDERVGNNYTRFWLREFRAGAEGSPEQDELRWYSDDEEPGTYSTKIFSDHADGFLRRASEQDKPWALLVWPNAPHTPLIPQEAYAEAEVPGWTPPRSFLRRDRKNKPPEIIKSKLQRKDPDLHVSLREGQLRMLMSVDDMVGRLFDTIDEFDWRDGTWGIFTSDNGWAWGEHGLTSKYYAYEHSARVPFRMAVPDQGRRTISSMIANIDVAPTLMRLAGDKKGHGFRGKSLLPLIRKKVGKVRSAFLIEAWTYGMYRSIRTARWKYIFWPRSKRRELYDLRRDPLELRNLAKKKKRVRRRLHRRMKRVYGSYW